jgi:hypothetical protein
MNNTGVLRKVDVYAGPSSISLKSYEKAEGATFTLVQKTCEQSHRPLRRLYEV